jgi:hypothetical protein
MNALLLVAAFSTLIPLMEPPLDPEVVGVVLERVEVVPKKCKTWSYRATYNTAPGGANAAKLSASMVEMLEALEGAKASAEICIKPRDPTCLTLAIGADKESDQPMLLSIRRVKGTKLVTYEAVFREVPETEQMDLVSTFLVQLYPKDFILREKENGKWVIELSSLRKGKVVTYTFEAKKPSD